MTAVPSRGASEHSALRGSAARFVPSDEKVLLVCRPSAWWIVMHRWVLIFIPAMIVVVGDVVLRTLAPEESSTLVVRPSVVAIIWVLLLLEYKIVAWLSRMYVLTERRLIVVSGFLARDTGDVPLTSVQHEVVYQNWWERLLRLGTVGVATAGTDGVTMFWLSVADPSGVLTTWRVAIDRARAAMRPSAPMPSVASAISDHYRPPPAFAESSPPMPMLSRQEREAPSWFPVIGLAGGIGAGKSSVAREFERLGCVVIDSDKEAREVLDRDDVRPQLVRWWGEQILRPDGRVDRRAIADIVFTRPAERTRLETLVHPLVRARRADLRNRAAAAGARGAVVDAPLLFEAGVDAECDVVVFVDAPREERLKRVMSTRGWDAAELDRREASQMPLDEKRSRCGLVIHNTGSAEDLARSVKQAFDQIDALKPNGA